MKSALLMTTAFAALLAAGVPGAEAADAKPVKSVSFSATPAPANTRDMVTPYTASTATVTFADGSTQTYPLTYTVLARSGDFVGGGYAGLIVDKAGKPILESTPDAKEGAARGPFKSSGPDGTSLLMIPGAKAEGVKGNTLYLVNHYEYDTEGQNVDPAKGPVGLYGKLPMVMNVTVLDQNPETGELKPVRIGNVDFSAVGGLWIPCNSSTTPWMTHLGSEEYEPDAAAFEKKPLDPMNLYLGTPGKTAAEGGANPYMYGHLVEVKVAADGKTEAVKHYATGRLAFELGDVMPDRKTVYLGDDGDDVVRAMFVADKEGDLSAGTLYAAKWQQTEAKDFGKAKIAWIKLGHATNDEIKKLIDGGITFSKIFDVAKPDEAKADAKKFEGYKPVFIYPGTGSKAALTYLKVKPGMEQAAAFLETRRYAATLGATTEFTKMEGQAHNTADKKLYTVLSYVQKGMLAGKNEDRPQDDIKLEGDAKDLVCGAVYESSMSGGQKDTGGAAIASDWVAGDMNALVYGAKKPEGQTAGKYDKCDTEKVANPDNVRYSEAMRTLFIGEDSGNHLNNFVWAYNVDAKTATRIFVAPAGAENTGLSVYDDYNGFAYITSNIQHPGAAEDMGKYPDEIKAGLRRLVDERGAVAYIGGLPALKR